MTSTDTAGNSASLQVSYTVVSGGGGGASSADVGITLSLSTNKVALGEELTYLMSVTNGSKTTSTGVVVSNTLPSGTVFFSAATTQGSFTAPPVGSNGTVTVNLGSLANNITASISITVTVTAQAGTDLIDTATVSATTQDLNSGNNTATKKITVSKK